MPNNGEMRMESVTEKGNDIYRYVIDFAEIKGFIPELNKDKNGNNSGSSDNTGSDTKKAGDYTEIGTTAAVKFRQMAPYIDSGVTIKVKEGSKSKKEESRDKEENSEDGKGRV